MARVKLAYPKIPGSQDSPLEKCIAFEKYDGTNLHWIWEPELGWYAFGTRRDRFDLDERGIAEFDAAHPGLREAAAIFVDDLSKSLDRVLAAQQYYCSSEITVFTEFLGAQSFAGMHKPDDPKQLVLIDVQTDQGMLEPEQFLRDFGSVNIAKVVYSGKLTGQFIEAVREGKYGVNEGVVCKGKNKEKGTWMVKIKTHDYMNRLKQAFKDDWENYWE
ncbi:MAG: hypothetical protein ACKO7W_16845 [Elainella sp.]